MAYIDDVLAFHRRRDFNEAEFLQALDEVLNSIRPVIEEKEETYRNVALLERLLSETPSKKERPKLLVRRGVELAADCRRVAVLCRRHTARIMQTERRMIL